MPLAKFMQIAYMQPALVTRIGRIGLSLLLLTGDFNLLGIDDHHVIPRIAMRRIDRLVSTAKNVRNFDRQTPQNLPFGIN